MTWPSVVSFVLTAWHIRPLSGERERERERESGGRDRVCVLGGGGGGGGGMEVKERDELCYRGF